MRLDELKIIITNLVNISDLENYLRNSEQIASAVKEYRETGGSGKILNQFITDIAPSYFDDEIKDEVILDIGLRINCHCSPHLRIHFDDFDESTGKWLSK